MSRLLLSSFLAMSILFGTGSTAALASEGGELNIGGDPCVHLVDVTPGIITLTVYHVAHLYPVQGYSQGSKFKIVLGPGITWTPTGHHTHGYAAVGDPFTGITIDYANVGCSANLATAILTMTFFSTGTTPPGSEVSIVAHPDEITPLGKTCLNQWVSVGVWSEFVNGGPCLDPGPIPVVSETWGAIKAIYR